MQNQVQVSNCEALGDTSVKKRVQVSYCEALRDIPVKKQVQVSYCEALWGYICEKASPGQLL